MRTHQHYHTIIISSHMHSLFLNRSSHTSTYSVSHKTHTFTLTHTFSLSHIHTHSFSISLSHTHTHTHTLFSMYIGLLKSLLCCQEYWWLVHGYLVLLWSTVAGIQQSGSSWLSAVLWYSFLCLFYPFCIIL